MGHLQLFLSILEQRDKGPDGNIDDDNDDDDDDDDDGNDDNSDDITSFEI